MVQVLRREPALAAPFPPAVAPNSAMGTRAPNAAPLNHGTRACASRASSRYALHSKKAAVTAHCPPKRTCIDTLLPDREMEAGLRYGKANPINNTPGYFANFDPVFPRDSSGRSIIFPFKEESASLATSSPFSKRINGKECSRARKLLPPA